MPEAAGVLAGARRVPGSPWALLGRKPGSRLRSVNAPWRVVRARAELEDVRIHDLRHSSDSRARALGEGLPTIGRLLGHTQVQIAARCAHLADDPLKAAANRIANRAASIAR